MIGMAYHYAPILTSLKSKGIMIILSPGKDDVLHLIVEAVPM
jgi:hypothetical protein